jgi:hypothetical protein
MYFLRLQLKKQSLSSLRVRKAESGFQNVTLEQLRAKAFFQNTIDVWIMLCEEKGWDWYNINAYRKFIAYLNSKEIKMQKFPLCIKESGGMYERGKDKTKFLDELSHFSSYDSAAYTIKLSNDVLTYIRSFNYS